VQSCDETAALLGEAEYGKDRIDELGAGIDEPFF
jgi:hypothetical protein